MLFGRDLAEISSFPRGSEDGLPLVSKIVGEDSDGCFLLSCQDDALHAVICSTTRTSDKCEELFSDLAHRFAVSGKGGSHRKHKRLSPPNP